MGSQESFLIIGILFLGVGIFAIVNGRPLRFIVLSFMFGIVDIAYYFFYEKMSLWIFLAILVILGIIISTVIKKKAV